MRGFFTLRAIVNVVPLLSAKGLTCIKRDRVLFENLSLSLHRGELVYLRGANGAGKTSLLRILTGLSKPTAGKVLFEGEPVSEAGSFAKQLIYLGHKSGLNGMFSAMENLYFWGAQHGLTFSNETLYATLERLGLVGMEDVPVRLLSAGQQRRAALARLWLKPAALWILDEPFTALDTEGVTLLEAAFHRHVQGGGTLLTTSHQPLSAVAGRQRFIDLEYRY